MIISFDILMEPNAYSGNKYEIIIFKSSLGTEKGRKIFVFLPFLFSSLDRLWRTDRGKHFEA